MPEIKISNEEPVTLVETRTTLDKIEKRDGSLRERAIKTKEYINMFTKKTTDKEVSELKKKLESADIGRLKPRHIIKIIDIMPKDIDSLKTLFASESITLKQEDLKKVLECLK